MPDQAFQPAVAPVLAASKLHPPSDRHTPLQNRMKATILSAMLLASSPALVAADVEIQSLTTNGALTFTNALTNGVFSLQWAPALPAGWSETWDSLKYFVPTSSVAIVSVPMFYRVTCLTNQLIPMPIGRQFIFSLTNAAGSAGSVQATFVGCLKLSSDKEYSILELRTPCAIRLLPCRSTTTEYYEIPFDVSTTEGVQWRIAPPGTTWTNHWCTGSVDQMTMLPSEVVTVPAGTFDCLKIEVRQPNENLRLRYAYWVKAGFIMVKMIDYGGDDTDLPETWTLTSWSDRWQR